jgi:hypothetical protein
MPFLFSNAFLLAALAGLGIPIALHLLMKQKQVRMKFSTNRFFTPQDPQAKARRKLRNLLLLLLRLLIFALIVFAFARPFLPFGTGAGQTARRQVVVVLDRSLSLQARDSSGLRWEAAQTATRQLLASLTANDRVALVACAQRAEVVSGFAPPTVVAQKLAALQPASTTSDLAEGLREATRLLRTGTPGFVSSVTVISDLQRAACDRLTTVSLPPELDVKLVAVGDRLAPNFTVTDLQLDPGETNRPFATITSFSDEPATGLPIEFRVDDRLLWTRPVTLAAGATTNLDLVLPALGEGWHTAEIRLKATDALGIDDRRLVPFQVPPPIRVLAVEGRRGVRSFAEQSFFLTAALDPHLGTPQAGSGRFRIETVRPEQLAAKLALTAPKTATTAPGDPATNRTPALPCDVVLLPAQRQWPAGIGPALAAYVRAGGGVALFVGDEASPTAFNPALADVLPAPLIRSEQAPAENPWRIASADRTSAPFDAFRQPNSGDLAVAEFTHRFQVQPAKDARVLARFEDGVPLVLALGVGAGRVVLVNTSADTTWTDWPKHKTFVPWVHGLTRHLAGRTDDRLLTAGPSAVTGTESTVELGAGQGERWTLLNPAGESLPLAVTPAGEAHFDVSLPGIHRLRDAAGLVQHAISAQVPAAESELTGLRPTDVQPRLVRAVDQSDGGVTTALFGSDQNRREYWRLLLLAAFGLIIVETVVSNRSTA